MDLHNRGYSDRRPRRSRMVVCNGLAVEGHFCDARRKRTSHRSPASGQRRRSRRERIVEECSVCDE